MRFIHTADWQIGKSFRRFGDKEELFRRARLDSIRRIGNLAQAEKVEHVLVAGDVYDSEAPTQKTLREPLERMREFGSVQWHLLPGNHDPHRPKGVWDRVRDTQPPNNIHLHLAPEPFDLGGGAVLLPAPLTRKSEGGDLTEWMDEAETQQASARIGLAHGSVTDFGTDGESQNPIAPTRPRTARLDYLALGDWHRTVQVGPAVWYSGTPEPDRAASQQVGTALLVELDGPGSTPKVTPHHVGTYHWLTLEERVDDASALDDFETRVRALPDCSSTVLRVVLRGALPLGGLAELRRRLEVLEAVVLHLEADQSGLVVRPSETDLEAIDYGGVLRQAAEELLRMAQDAAKSAEARQLAEDSLIELYLRQATAQRSQGATA